MSNTSQPQILVNTFMALWNESMLKGISSIVWNKSKRYYNNNSIITNNWFWHYNILLISEIYIIVTSKYCHYKLQPFRGKINIGQTDIMAFQSDSNHQLLLGKWANSETSQFQTKIGEIQ